MNAEQRKKDFALYLQGQVKSITNYLSGISKDIVENAVKTATSGVNSNIYDIFDVSIAETINDLVHKDPKNNDRSVINYGGFPGSACAHYVKFLKQYSTASPSGASTTSTAVPKYHIIYFGAPGSGKSYTLNEETKDCDVIRTTFHPDSDYSTFVGVFKPIEVSRRKTQVVWDFTSLSAIELPVRKKDDDGGFVDVYENVISYRFIRQAFLQAYIKAWLKAGKTEDEDATEKNIQYLIIEEINRGNCAQIFGDLFQSLDRNESGYSKYPIIPDADIQKELGIALQDAVIPAELDTIFPEEFTWLDEQNIEHKEKATEAIKNGHVIILPNNLYLRATMNTSDQSLFPMDSAFKRRWDWRFFAIKDEKKEHKIKRSTGTDYDWWEIISTLNAKILNITQSADKQMGYFFMKPVDGQPISAEDFVSKVIFYLWNDIFKDYSLDDENNPFADDMRFEDFYTSDGKVKVSVLERFLDNIKKEYDSLHPVEVVTGTEAEKEETEETIETSAEEVTEVTE